MRGRPRPTRSTRLGPSELARLADQPALVHHGYLITGTADAPHALSLRCSHLGCTVALDPDRSQLVCPCHGSRFDLDGKVVAGPARQPLRPARLRRDGDDWVVDG